MINLSHVQWRKSRRSSAGDNCVEVAKVAGVRAIRDSKNPDGEPIVLDPTRFAVFAAGVKAGQHDL